MRVRRPYVGVFLAMKSAVNEVIGSLKGYIKEIDAVLISLVNGGLARKMTRTHDGGVKHHCKQCRQSIASYRQHLCLLTEKGRGD